MSGQHEHNGKNIKTAFLLNFSFTIIELIGGLLTNSIAILSDAVHDLGDSISLGLAWYFERLSKRGPTSENTYGYRRYSLLGGLITAVVLIIGLAFVLWNAVSRLLSPEEVNAPGMMLLAILGIIFNGAAVLRVRKGSSLTERVVSWHLLEDTLGWLAVLFGAGIMSIGISLSSIRFYLSQFRFLFFGMSLEICASFFMYSYKLLRRALMSKDLRSMYCRSRKSVRLTILIVGLSTEKAMY